MNAIVRFRNRAVYVLQCKPVSDSGIFIPIFTYIAAIYARLYQNDRFKQKLDE